jgi:hypothetical protein
MKRIGPFKTTHKNYEKRSTNIYFLNIDFFAYIDESNIDSLSKRVLIVINVLFCVFFSFLFFFPSFFCSTTVPPNLMDIRQKEELYRCVMGDIYSVAENTALTSVFNPRNPKPPPPYVPAKKHAK